MRNITVKEFIETLKDFPEDFIVEVCTDTIVVEWSSDPIFYNYHNKVRIEGT